MFYSCMGWLCCESPLGTIHPLAPLVAGGHGLKLCLDKYFQYLRCRCSCFCSENICKCLPLLCGSDDQVIQSHLDTLNKEGSQVSQVLTAKCHPSSSTSPWGQHKNCFLVFQFLTMVVRSQRLITSSWFLKHAHEV